MSVIAFPPSDRRRGGPWRDGELTQILAALRPELSRGAATGWEVGATEAGDPQFYLLGPGEDCILCISRLRRLYVLEDGRGRVLFEHASLRMLAQRARTFLRRARSRLIACVFVLWCCLRHACEEKLESVFAEAEELLAHAAPQLALFA